MIWIVYYKLYALIIHFRLFCIFYLKHMIVQAVQSEQ